MTSNHVYHLFVVLLALTSLALVVAQSHTNDKHHHHESEHVLEQPDVFDRRGGGERHSCHENAMVHAWCDSHILKELECGLLPEFDEYGCTCYGHPNECPSECLGGTQPLLQTHYGIRCGTIPDVHELPPNYILRERHALQRCEENSLVSSWCDDHVNVHLECGLYPDEDQYLCRCTGKATNCPDECIHGQEPLVKTRNSVLCLHIPKDEPNYVVLEQE